MILSITCLQFFRMYDDFNSPNILILVRKSNTYMIKTAKRNKITIASVCRKFFRDSVLAVALVGENIW